MPGKKLWNSDLDLRGKAIISTVPNSLGTVLTYNVNKEVSTRTNLEFTNDLSLMTTNTFQTVSGLKSVNRFRNTGTGWGNTIATTDYSMIFETSSGANSSAKSTSSIGFFSSNGVQAGIYVRSNNSDGTSMAFATTNSFGLGPQISMTISSLGTVDFPRAWPTVAGKNIFHGGNTIDYDHGVVDIISVGDPSWAQRKLLSTHWDGTYGDHLILRPVGLSANTATFKLAQNGNAYVNDKRVLTETDSSGYVKIGGASTFNNPVYLGWDNNNLRITVDSSYIGYVWHSNNLDPVTRNTQQDIIGRKIFSGAFGNDYYNSAIMINGNGTNLYPTIGFHQTGVVGATLSVRNDGNLYYNDKIIYHSGNLNLTGIAVNQDFTTGPFGTNNHVAISDNSFGDESGLWDLNYEYAIAIKWGDDYLYGGALGSYAGLSWNMNNQNVGIGMKATTAAKVNVLGAVKASGNFKSTTESANETFIANGTTAKLDKEVKNVAHPSGGTGLRVEPAEYFVPSSSFLTVDDDNRFLVIIGEQSKQVVNLVNIYPRQSINIYNFDPRGLGLHVQINGSYLMTIPAFRMQEYWVTQDQRLIRKNGQVECEFIY